ncbi:MAG: hypothetical protein BMS9Abin36_0232 [Gammaproteobacteria bacterium]|nr:MAG: hypothetical protein BMS9Abin36_0232 [Gammaproteobacteria bacterium]
MQVRKIARLVLFIAFFAYLAPSHARELGGDGRFYWGIDIFQAETVATRAEVTDDTLNTTIVVDGTFKSDEDINAYALKFGYEFTNFLGVEIHYSQADEVETTLADGSVLSSKIDYAGSAFIRAQYPFEKIKLYMLVGGTYAQWSADCNSASGCGGAFTTGPETAPVAVGPVSLKETQAGLAYGAGMEVYGSPYTGFNISWIKYLDRDTFEQTAVGVGFFHHFDFPRIFRRF